METTILDKRLIGAVTLRSVVTFVISILAFAAISWIYFYPNDVQGDVLQQNDVMQGAANGQEAKVYNETHNGEATWWTNSLFGGMPTFQIAPSYDSNSMINKLGRVLTLGFPEPVSWIFLLMLGFFILMLSFKMKWYLAVLGAIGYAFSSYFFIIIDAGHIWKLLVLCYIPPTIAGIVWAYRGKYLLGGAVAAFFATLQLISNHVQMTYYSMFIIVPLVIAFLVIAIKDKKIGQWCIATCVLAVAAALALGANASNLYLSYKYSQETMRGGHSELTPLPAKAGEQQVSSEPTNGGLSKEYITQWSYGIGETWTLMVPNVKGGTSMKTLADVDNADEMALGSELGLEGMQAFSQYFGDQPFTSGPVYVGALFFVLFILSIFVVKGPVKWALLISTILSILLSWGHNFMGLTEFFIDYFPMYNKFRTVSSILVVAEFAIPLLAVLGLKEMFTQEDFFKRYGKLIYIVFGTCAALCLVFAFIPSLFGGGATEREIDSINKYLQGQATFDQLPGLAMAVEAIRHSLVSADAWRSLAIIALGFATILAYRFEKLNALTTTLIIAVIALADMFMVNKRYLNEERFVSRDDLPETTFEKTPADAKILADTTQNYRVFDMQNFMHPRSSYFHKTIGGYHAAKLTRYNDLIERQIAKNNTEIVNMLNGKWVITPDGDAQQNPGALGNAWFVDSLTYVKTADQEMKFLDTIKPATSAVADVKFKDALGNAKPTEPGDTIFETTYAPNKLTYHAHSAQGGVAVFSEVYFPWGWTATVDGKEAKIGRVNYVLRALQLPAGDHTIVFTFDPQEVHQTEGIAKASVYGILLLVVAALGWAIFSGMRRKEEKEEKDEKKTE
ncbi:MAG: YfhO family protein [Muribaculaceae bacterium]|nr:YfhO family protein [Muribaculaceae bacterium]